MSKEGVILDSLPYIDAHYNSTRIKSKVHALLDAEKSKSTKRPSDYLKEIDAKFPTPSLDTCELFKGAVEALNRGKHPEHVDFAAQYHVAFPTGDTAEDITQLKSALNTLRASSELESSHVLDLELLKQHGSAAWLKTLERVEVQKNLIENEVKSVKDEIASITRRRKQDQLNLGMQMSELEAIHGDLVQQNHALAYERFRLQSHIKRMKK